MLNMFQDYTEFKCIKEMKETTRERFDNIVKEYADKLNHIISDSGTVYTLHDFDHHCCNLYKIVSDVVLNEEIAFTRNGSSIKDKELFILNLAILLHDLGMTKHIDLTRDNHSLISADMIRENYQNAANPLSEGKSGLCKNEIEILALIVQAHSDVKDGSIRSEINGLRNPDLTNNMPGRVHNIRARFLANILRLADELDITSDRLGSMDIRNELEEAVKDKRVIEKQLENIADKEERKALEIRLERYKSAEISERFWRLLTLFKTIERDAAGNVKIHTDDKVIENEIATGVSDNLLAKDILEVIEKIQREFEIFKKDVETDLQLAAMIAIKKIEIYTKNNKLREMLENFKKKSEVRINRENDFQPHVISSELEVKITNFIEKRNLYDTGHYRLHDNLCARDWIAVDEIVLTESFFKKCETQLLLHLQKLENLSDKYLIIGIDFYGMLIASRLAFILHKPYDYLIPDYRRTKSSSKEFNLECSIDKFEDVIIITDVIVTFSTIKKLSDDYGIKDKIKAIYAILFRKMKGIEYEQKSENMLNKTYVLNSKYDIELQKNDNCRYKDKEDACRAKNKIYY